MKKEIDCCWKNIDKAKRLGRASYICPVCKKDVSFIWFLWESAKLKQNNEKNN